MYTFRDQRSSATVLFSLTKAGGTLNSTLIEGFFPKVSLSVAKCYQNLQYRAKWRG